MEQLQPLARCLRTYLLSHFKKSLQVLQINVPFPIPTKSQGSLYKIYL